MQRTNDSKFVVERFLVVARAHSSILVLLVPTSMQFEYSSAETKKVGRVQFGVLGPDEVVSLLPSPFHLQVPASASTHDLPPFAESDVSVRSDGRHHSLRERSAS